MNTARPTSAARLSVSWTNATLRLGLTGTLGRTYITEASTNLIAWTPNATNLLSSNPTNVLASGFTGHRTRFYRAKNGR